jgi:hypothetical protein
MASVFWDWKGILLINFLPCGETINGWMKGIQNKKCISETVIHVSGLCHRKGKLWKYFFHARLMCMHHLVTFGELSNDVDTTGTGSMHVVASRVAISYGSIASF